MMDKGDSCVAGSLLSAERLPVLEVAKRSGVSRPMVGRWHRRYAEERRRGIAALQDTTSGHGPDILGQGARCRRISA